MRLLAVPVPRLLDKYERRIKFVDNNGELVLLSVLLSFQLISDVYVFACIANLGKVLSEAGSFDAQI